VQCWRDKYKFNFWRPIIAIRNADLDTLAGTAELKDPAWQQLGAPSTNDFKPGINPAFPSYPSGHTTTGTAAFTVIQRLLKIPVDREYPMVSDEFNGINRDEFGVPRPRVIRTQTFEDAVVENERSRVYLGVHYDFDCTQGSMLGRVIAEDVVDSFPGKA
jgi:membrane-associated phospholipid phosphatase